MFGLSIRKMIFSPVHYIAVLLLTMSAVISVIPLNQYVLYLHQYSFHIGVEIYFMPVASVLPVCCFFKEIFCSNTYLFFLKRTTKVRFLLSGMISAVFSGMMIMACSYVMFTLLCFLSTAPMELDFTMFLTAYEYDSWSGIRIFLYSGLIYCLNGCIYPMIAYTVIICTKNTYLAVSMPFIIRTLIGYIVQSLNIDQSSLLNYLDMGHLKLSSGIAYQWPGHGFSYLIAYIVLLLGICCIICSWKMDSWYKGR